jgi:uncharacterized membrane protein YkvA (DUF1232 family)
VRAGDPGYDRPVSKDRPLPPPPPAFGTPSPAANPGDPFPRDRFGAMLHRLPAYLRLAWRLGRDPLLGKARRAAVVAAAGYLASPIDLVPGFIPVLGQLDDLAVAIAALRLALDGLSPERRHQHLDAVGLEDADLTHDLRTIAATVAWIGRAGVRLTVRVIREGGEVAITGAGIAARSGRSALASARRRVTGRIAGRLRSPSPPA